jgi:hypothetical protein
MQHSNSFVGWKRASQKACVHPSAAHQHADLLPAYCCCCCCCPPFFFQVVLLASALPTPGTNSPPYQSPIHHTTHQTTHAMLNGSSSTAKMTINAPPRLPALATQQRLLKRPFANTSSAHTHTHTTHTSLRRKGGGWTTSTLAPGTTHAYQQTTSPVVGSTDRPWAVRALLKPK